MARYRMSLEDWWKLAFALAFFAVAIPVLVGWLFGVTVSTKDQWLLAGSGFFGSTFSYVRDRHLPKRPSEYERGFADGAKLKQ